MTTATMVEPGAVTVGQCKTGQEGQGSVRSTVPPTWAAVLDRIKAMGLETTQPLRRSLGPANPRTRPGVQREARRQRSRPWDSLPVGGHQDLRGQGS